MGVVAFIAAIPAATAHELPPQQLDDHGAQFLVLRDILRDFVPTGAGAIFQKAVPVAVEDLYFPGDLKDLGEYRWKLDSLEDYPRDRAAVEQWYLSQVPDEYRTLELDRDSLIRILYLPACTPGWVGDGLPADLAENVSDIDRRAFERARVAVVLEREGIANITVPALSTRQNYRRRAAPDPGMLQLNRLLLDRHLHPGASATPTKEPVLVLESYCGPITDEPLFPGVEPPPPPSPPPPPPPPWPTYYRLALPPGVTPVAAAPRFWAEVCNTKTGSALNTGCVWYRPVSGQMTGYGRYRLIAVEGGQRKRYSYEVKPINLNESATAPPVTVVPEP